MWAARQDFVYQYSMSHFASKHLTSAWCRDAYICFQQYGMIIAGLQQVICSLSLLQFYGGCKYFCQSR